MVVCLTSSVLWRHLENTPLIFLSLLASDFNPDSAGGADPVEKTREESGGDIAGLDFLKLRRVFRLVFFSFRTWGALSTRSEECRAVGRNTR